MKIIKENKYFIFNKPQTFSIKDYIKDLLREKKYKVLLKKYRPENIIDKKYRVSICAIFKNEAAYLREWIEFHKIVGVEHFYLYNNFSTDNYLDILKPYIDDDTVSLLDWNFEHQQMQCYKDAIKRFSSETNWLGFIDIDEFVVPNSTDNIFDYLKDFYHYPAVLIYWKLFGASGNLHRDKKSLVINDFTVSADKYSDIGKCFYNTAYDYYDCKDNDLGMHHKFWASFKNKKLSPINEFGFPSFNEHWNPVKKNINYKNFPIQINHYFTKSFDEYIEKSSRGDVFFKESKLTIEHFYEQNMKCQSSDFHAYKYLVQLKLNLENNNKH